MNQTFNGFMLLGIVILITVVLFAVAYFIKPKQSSQRAAPKKTSNKRFATHKSSAKNTATFKSKKGAFKIQANSQLITLKKRITKHFPEFTATLRQNYLILERASEKVAMLTIDKAAAVGRRRLGQVTVINFHELPSVEELKIELKGM